ncbi:hypothetical protein V1477_000314 [Vespula maculifrons]|uniref:Uncharacterized protein n=1 Tax=Vespula maculifrons TaxID=7453 RepID=A0ABD2D1H3_VESMC
MYCALFRRSLDEFKRRVRGRVDDDGGDGVGNGNASGSGSGSGSGDGDTDVGWMNVPRYFKNLRNYSMRDENGCVQMNKIRVEE